MSLRLGVDVGGTFTDLVALGGDGEMVTAKVPSTPADQSEGVTSALRASGVEPADVLAFSHGMTVATNALLERRGARTALVTTEGFRDVIEIARQNRPSLYDLSANRPSALIPRELRFTVRERVGPEGGISPLDEDSLRETVELIKDCRAEAVAVCLLFSFVDPAHEQRVGETLREALPGVQVSLSSEVLPEFREYERFSTTAADAYLGPGLSYYLKNLATSAGQSGVPAPYIMQSSGGILPISDAAEEASSFVLSGPAAGVVAATHVGALGGYRDLLTFDMGGTSTDVAPVVDGEAQTTTETVVAGIPIKKPMVDIHTVSAGGGSIAWADAGGALRAGPHSAGAKPGPAAYGLGGTEPTVTDANLYLGYLRDGAELGGEVRLDRDLSERALNNLGDDLGLDAAQIARGVVRVADAEMARALRVISVERGLDPRQFALLAFGGAGAMHACSLADDLGMSTVLAPKAGGVFSALGLCISDLRRDYVRPLLSDLREVDTADAERLFAGMEAEAAGDLASGGASGVDAADYTRRADLRYGGQSFELTIEAASVEDLRSRFHAAHEKRYGYRMDDESVELVNLRLVATVPVDKPEPVESPATGPAEVESRRANFGGQWLDISVLDRERMGEGSTVEGPAIVEFAESTCVVLPGWGGEVDRVGTLVLSRNEVREARGE